MLPIKTAQIIVLLFCIMPSNKEAKIVMKRLMEMGMVEKGLTAPAAAFISDGKRIKTDKEVIFFTMIREKAVKKAMAEIKKIHPEENPCMLAIPVIADDDFAMGHVPFHITDCLVELTDEEEDL